MSFILANQNQSKSQIADEESRKAKLLNQELQKISSEELSKEIIDTISIGMETPNGVTEGTSKSDFAFYSLILASAVILGVVGYIYYSVDSKPSKALNAPDVD
jgi:hypothetical protein